MALERETAVAIEAVVLASRLCQTVQARLVQGTTLQKGDKSPVTVADFGAQAIVSAHLLAAFPADPLIGEEDASALRDGDHVGLRDRVTASVRTVRPELSDDAILAAIDRGMYAGGPGRCWTLDPIDGTKGFLRVEQYAVALALLEDGVPVVGVLGCPNLPVDPEDASAGTGCVFYASRGGGAFMVPLDGGDPRPVRVDTFADPSLARFCESVESGHSNQDDSADVGRRLGITRAPIRMDSQCKYGTVARGTASIYLRMPTRKDYVERIWDHAAGWMVITEAGGRVSDVTGAPLDFSCGRGLERNKGVVATNGLLHDAVIAAIRATLAG
jgi:3'(2'), 5'-bisphosphate nucleotidase